MLFSVTYLYTYILSLVSRQAARNTSRPEEEPRYVTIGGNLIPVCSNFIPMYAHICYVTCSSIITVLSTAVIGSFHTVDSELIVDCAAL